MDGKIQAFPWEMWEKEFEIAKQIGLETIGWIFEDTRWQENPLWTEAGRKRMKEMMEKTGVRIEYVCADYFMEHPFIRVSQADYDRTRTMLTEIMRRSPDVGVRGIELPMVDNSKIDTEDEKQVIIKTLKEYIPLMEELNLELSIESSLPPQDLKDLLERLDHPLFCVTYDTGNSSSLGYDTTEEVEAFGRWIHNVHIKDRLLHGTTVPLGTGNAHFDKTFAALARIGYQGSFTLQAARSVDPVENTKNQLVFLHAYIDGYLKK